MKLSVPPPVRRSAFRLSVRHPRAKARTPNQRGFMGSMRGILFRRSLSPDHYPLGQRARLPAPVCLVLIMSLALAAEMGQGAEPSSTILPNPSELGDLEFDQLSQLKVTSVTRQESTVQQSAAAVFVITPDLIQRSGATTFPELFRMVPGMNVARIDNNKWAVSARGFNDRFGGKLLVQVDGRTIYNPIFSGVYWDAADYPLEDIERIEVIRGPGASVWGANAVNGVINIVTKSAKETQGGLLSSGGGTEERGFGVFRYGGKINESLFYRVYGKGFDRDEQFSRQGNPRDGWQGASGGLRLDWHPGDRDTVTVQGGYLYSAAGRMDLRPRASPPFFYQNAEKDSSQSGNILGRWSHQINEDSNWTLQLYWDRVHRTSDRGIVDLQWDTYDADFNHQFSLGTRNKFIYGFGYRLIDAFTRDSTLDNGFAVAWPQPARALQLFSTFAQDEISLIEDQLSLTLGSKLEHNDMTGFEIQPTARLLWTPTQRQTVWAAVSRAARTPTFLEDKARIKTITTPGSKNLLEIRGNAGIESEDSLAYDLGYRLQATERLSFDLAVFYNVYDDLIGGVRGTPEPNPPIVIIPVNRANILDGETYGLELGTTWHISDGWRLSGAYTVLKMNLHRASGLPPSVEAAEGQSPRQQVSLQSNWDLSRNVQFDLMGRFVDRLQGFNPGGAAGVSDVVSEYFSLDARLSWRPRQNLEFSLVGQNLLDNHHPEFGTSPVVKSPLVEIERSVYGKVTWRF